MSDRDKQKDTAKPSDDEATKPAGQDVRPPIERVDDEVGSDEQKITKRQE